MFHPLARSGTGANGVRPTLTVPGARGNVTSLGPVWQRVPTVGIYYITYTTACAMATGMQGEPPLDPSPAIMLNGNLIRPSELAAARNFCRPPVVQRGALPFGTGLAHSATVDRLSAKDWVIQLCPSWGSTVFSTICAQDIAAAVPCAASSCHQCPPAAPLR